MEQSKKSNVKIKLSDDELYALVKQDIDAAEEYFDDNIKADLITRYQLLNSNKGYYQDKFKVLSQFSDFSTTDIKDAVEWIMPSMIEIIFGAEKIVGVLGRTSEDNPEPMEKLMGYQIKTQNKGYIILEQAIRDCFEAGLGVIKCEWCRITEKVKESVTIPEQQFLEMNPDEIDDVKDNGDGTYTITVTIEKRVKDQPVIENLMPGRWIFLPEVDDAGVSLFEAERGYILYSDLMKLQKSGYVQNVDKIDPKTASAKDRSSFDEIADAILNYSGQRVAKQSDENNHGRTPTDTQPARQKIPFYKCYAKYDVNDDGLLEDVIVWVAGQTIIRKEINPFSRPGFIDGYGFEKSYSRWKEAIADILQDIQDLKTALIRQVIINTAMNNDRKVAIDEKQETGLTDITNGSKSVRLKLGQNQSVSDVLAHFPAHQLSPETFPLIEMITGWSEQKTGVTRYNQGLDADSLNKTATGISKIMAASQQRLRKIARNLGETILVPLYRYLVEMNQAMVDNEMVVRLTGQYLKIAPDDLRGTFDTEIVSNVGLQDSQLTVQNLMVMFTQIVPGLMQMGIANELGVYETATQLIEAMGFNRPELFLGKSEQEVQAMMQQKDVMAQLPQMLVAIMKQVGIEPEKAAQIVQGLTSVMQPQQQQPAQQGA